MTALGASMPDVVAAIYAAFDAGELALAMRLQRSVLAILRQADSLVFPLGYKLLAKAAGMKMEEIGGEQSAEVYTAMLQRLGKESS